MKLVQPFVLGCLVLWISAAVGPWWLGATIVLMAAFVHRLSITVERFIDDTARQTAEELHKQIESIGEK
jgi:hypothetical protein